MKGEVMLATRAIEVPLPEGVEPSVDDVALLTSLCSAIVGLRYAGSHRWEETARRLENAGWRVHWGLTWFAEARRDAHIEQATGRTRDEALAELWQLTLVDEVDGCP
jgi:hypothetical protein